MGYVPTFSLPVCKKIRNGNAHALLQAILLATRSRQNPAIIGKKVLRMDSAIIEKRGNLKITQENLEILGKVALYDLFNFQPEQTDRDFCLKPGTARRFKELYPHEIINAKQDLQHTARSELIKDYMLQSETMITNAKIALEIEVCAMKAIPWEHSSGEMVNVTNQQLASAKTILGFYQAWVKDQIKHKEKIDPGDSADDKPIIEINPEFMRTAMGEQP